MHCVFSIGNGPRRDRPPTIAASQFPSSKFYCYWVLATKASWVPFTNLHCCAFYKCTIHQSSALRLPQVLHHLSSQFCTIRQHCSAPVVSCCSAPFVSLVLHHSLATILCHVIMLPYDSTLSTIMFYIINQCEYALSTI